MLKKNARNELAVNRLEVIEDDYSGPITNESAKKMAF